MAILIISYRFKIRWHNFSRILCTCITDSFLLNSFSLLLSQIMVRNSKYFQKKVRKWIFNGGPIIMQRIVCVISQSHLWSTSVRYFVSSEQQFTCKTQYYLSIFSGIILPWWHIILTCLEIYNKLVHIQLRLKVIYINCI